MHRIILVFTFFYAGSLLAQNNTVSDQLIKASLETSYTYKTPGRKLLSVKKGLARYNPLSYIGAGLMYVYQNVVSEQIQADCTYEISCSEFTKLSIQQYGFMNGLLKGFNQLSECHQLAKYEHPQMFVNDNKIANRIDKEDK